MKIETVQTDAFEMDCFHFGQGKNPLVILPGLSVQSVMGSVSAIAKAYQPLTQDYTLYLFDRRKQLPPVYSMEEMSQDTAEAIKALGFEHVSIFGASQGGMIAMKIAISHPELVEKLILGSTAASVPKTLYQRAENWIELAKAGRAAALYLAFGEALYPKEIFEQSRDLLVDAAETVTEEDLQRFIILAKAMEGFDVTDDLKKINCPVLVLTSKDDRVMGADAATTIADCLQDRPGFELYMYEGYGHAAYDTAPDYKERMLQFLLHSY